MVFRIVAVCLVISAFITFSDAGKSFPGFNMSNGVLSFIMIAPLLLLAVYKKNEAQYNVIRLNLLRSISFGVLGFIWLSGAQLFGIYSWETIFNIPQTKSDGNFSIPFQIITLLVRAAILTGIVVNFAALFYLLLGINSFINIIKTETSSQKVE